MSLKSVSRFSFKFQLLLASFCATLLPTNCHIVRVRESEHIQERDKERNIKDLNGLEDDGSDDVMGSQRTRREINSGRR